jgi:hypothetical protein
MSDMAEDRVYADRAGNDRLVVASDAGLTRVAVANGRVGRFSLERRCTPRDLAVGSGWIAVATDEDVLLRRGDGAYVETGFGPAVAVGADGDDLIAADEDSAIRRSLAVDPADPGEWLPLADVDAPIRAIDGGLIAAGDGVYRLHADGLDHAGLDDARDVSAAWTPLVATGEGLFRLGNGWLREVAGEATVVAAHADGRAGAVVDGRLHEREAGEWVARGIDDEPVALCHGQRPYAVTADGTVLSADPDAADGWRRRALGLPGVVAAVVAGSAAAE